MEKGVLHTSRMSATFEKTSVFFFPEGRKEEGEGVGEERRRTTNLRCRKSSGNRL